jgi:two-component system chemotaxis response regulator CheY
MIIIDQNVEKTLMKEVYEIQVNGYIRRCLYLQLSRFSGVNDQTIPNFIKAIKKFFAEENGQVFVCEDNDLAVFTDKASRKRIAQFLSYVSQNLSSDPSIPTGGLATIFEVDMNWNELIKICKAKLQLIKRREQKEAEEKAHVLEALKRQKILGMELNAEQLETLANRRLIREQTCVMVIEDDVFTQSLVKKVLPQKCDVVMSADGYSALTLYVKTAPDIVFLDIGLPDVTGHDLLEKILEIDPEAFIVMLSGSGDQANIMQAVKAGAKGFIGKPFTKDKVREYLQRSTHIQHKEHRYG